MLSRYDTVYLGDCLTISILMNCLNFIRTVGKGKVGADVVWNNHNSGGFPYLKRG